MLERRSRCKSETVNCADVFINSLPVVEYLINITHELSGRFAFEKFEIVTAV